jgi:hypothetical protein
MGMLRPRTSPGDIAGILFAVAIFSVLCAAPKASVAAPAVPVIDIVMASRGSLFGSQSTEIFCVAHHDDGFPLAYNWTSSDGLLIPSGDSALWFAPEVPGTYPIIIEVHDDVGGFTSDTVSITVEQNEPPVVLSLTATPSQLLPGESSILTCEAYDEEGHAIDYEWLAPSGLLTGSGPTVAWTAPERPGDHRVAIKVLDELGATRTSDVIITVRCPEPPVIGELLVWPTLPDYTKLDIHGGYRLLRGQFTTCEIECVTVPSDADVTYTWSCTAGTIAGTGNIVLFTPPHDTAEVYVTATVSDICGQSAEAEVLFRVFLREEYPTEVPSAPGCLRCARGY